MARRDGRARRRGLGVLERVDPAGRQRHRRRRRGRGRCGGHRRGRDDRRLRPPRRLQRRRRLGGRRLVRARRMPDRRRHSRRSPMHRPLLGLGVEDDRAERDGVHAWPRLLERRRGEVALALPAAGDADRHHRHGQLGLPGRDEGLEAVRGGRAAPRDAPHLENGRVRLGVPRLPLVGRRRVGDAVQHRREERQRNDVRDPRDERLQPMPQRQSRYGPRDRLRRPRQPGRHRGHCWRRSKPSTRSRRTRPRRRSRSPRTRRARPPPRSGGCTSTAVSRATTRTRAPERRRRSSI